MIPKSSTSKIKVGPGRNHLASPAVSIGQVGGTDQLALSVHLHGGHTLIPPCDDPAAAEEEHERLAAVHRAVELCPVLEPPRVVDRHGVARRGAGPGALNEVYIPKHRIESVLPYLYHAVH